MKREILIVSFTIFTLSCKAQDAPAALVTDRPDQAESAEVVPLKSLQIETGFLVENDNSSAVKTRSSAYNSTLLRYGLLPNMELRFGMEYLGVKTKIPGGEWTNATTGLSTLYTGFKIKISEENGCIPGMALLGALELPFTATDDFKPAYTGGNMIFAFSNTLSDQLALGYNLGVEWDGETANPAYIYAVSLGIGITEKIGIFVESYGTFSEEGKAAHLTDTGITFLVLPNLQLDLSGGIGISHAPDNYAGLGFSYRIPN